MDNKYRINESFSDTLFHFTTFSGAFYIVKYDRFFLTNIIDAAREKQFNRDKLYYMSLARHFNSTMGYVGTKNEGSGFGSKYLNVRIELDGRILSYNHKGVNVNNVGKAADVITNRQQEERLISDEPEVADAHKYIKGIYIYNPNVGNPNKKGKTITNLRRQILFMMQQPHYERKIFVFSNEEAFNNISMAINTGAVVDPKLIEQLAVSPSEEVDGSTIELDSNQIITSARIYALLQLLERNSVDDLFIGNDERWNKALPLIKKEGLRIIDEMYSDPRRANTYIFGSLLGNNLKTNFGGDYKQFYRYIIAPIYKYMNSRGIDEFNKLQKWKHKLFADAIGLRYEPEIDMSKIHYGLDNSNYIAKKVAVGENIYRKSLSQIIKETIDNVIDDKKQIKLVIFDFDGTLVDTTAIDNYRTQAKSIKDKNERLEFYRQFFQETKPYSGIVNVLNKLNSMGILIAVVSLSPKNMVQELCSYHNLPIQMAISVPGRKAPLNVIKGNQTGYPKSTIYRILMDKLGIDKESVLAVGDESSDAREASKAGIYFLGCNWGGRNEVNDISNPMDILDYV